MKDYIVKRTLDVANYMVETSCTVRSAAAKFKISKSTVHKDISERLKMLSPTIFLQVKKLLETNKSERHIRGGNATKIKYMTKSQKSNRIY